MKLSSCSTWSASSWSNWFNQPADQAKIKKSAKKNLLKILRKWSCLDHVHRPVSDFALTVLFVYSFIALSSANIQLMIGSPGIRVLQPLLQVQVSVVPTGFQCEHLGPGRSKNLLHNPFELRLLFKNFKRVALKKVLKAFLGNRDRNTIGNSKPFQRKTL